MKTNTWLIVGGLIVLYILYTQAQTARITAISNSNNSTAGLVGLGISGAGAILSDLNFDDEDDS